MADGLLEERVRELEDERAILRTLYTYGHGIDYGLEEQFLDCWTEDAVLSGRTGPRWPAVRPSPRRSGPTRTPRTFFHKHVIVEPRIDIDGERATSECYFARWDDYEEGPEIRSFGRYRDVLIRCPDGRWRFQERRTEREARRWSAIRGQEVK